MTTERLPTPAAPEPFDSNQRNIKIPFKSEYPLNWEFQTRSGHKFRMNDTDGGESIMIQHTNGTIIDIGMDGMSVTVRGKTTHYYNDGFSETVDGHKDVKIRGALNVNVSNSISEKVTKNWYVGVGGDYLIGVNGNKTSFVGADNFSTVSGNEIVSIEGSENNHVQGDSVKQIDGKKVDMIGDDWSVTADANVEVINNNGTFRIKCKTFVIEAESIELTSSSGDVKIISAGNLSTSSIGKTEMNSTSEMNITSVGTSTIQSTSLVNLISSTPPKANSRQIVTY